jgi:hypothetical protein
MVGKDKYSSSKVEYVRLFEVYAISEVVAASEICF